MDVCQALDYGGYSPNDVFYSSIIPGYQYYNEIFTPGVPYRGALPAACRYDGDGNPMVPVDGNAYDNRDDPDTDPVEYYFDPTDSNGEGYPVPVYRDYYNNYTGQCLDPNFNGLCDDDLDGDGVAGIVGDPSTGTGPDMEDIEMATNGRLLTYGDVYPNTYATRPPPNGMGLGNAYVPGDGLYDTVVEGAYVASMDPMYRAIRRTESVSPIIDFSLQLDRSHVPAVGDYRHRETPFKNFVRMTSFIDPTPPLGDPNNVDTWIDHLYIRDNRVPIGDYTIFDVRKLLLCLNRDLPAYGGLNNYDVGVDQAGLVNLDAFSVNYTPPVYGMKIIVTVFYLTGQGEMQTVDINNDGILEEIPKETYGGARRIRLERFFYNTWEFNASQKMYAPPRRFNQSSSGSVDNPVRSLTIPNVTGTGLDSDPCDLENKGLPYLQ
jgi:hypothetical protein